MSKRVLIIGASGQDGRCLREQLLTQDCEIWNLSTDGLWQEGQGNRESFSVLEKNQLADFFRRTPPDELYYLAAFHHSAQERAAFSEEDLWHFSLQVQVQGWVNCLLAIKEHAPDCHSVYASSSHVFGRPPVWPQSETTPLAPVNIYGVTKVAGMQAARFYREIHGLKASSLILYNHESIFRSEKFVSQKIIQTLRRIREGKEQRLVLGDLEAVVDWGYAPDYVRAMQLVAGLGAGDDFVVATGERRRVREFANLAAAALDLVPEGIVVEDPLLLGRNYRRTTLVGDATKLRNKTGWKPSLSFEQMVALLVEN